MVQLALRLYYSDDILMINIQTHPIKHPPITKKLDRTNIYQIYRGFDSEYRISFKILTTFQKCNYNKV